MHNRLYKDSFKDKFILYFGGFNRKLKIIQDICQKEISFARKINDWMTQTYKLKPEIRLTPPSNLRSTNLRSTNLRSTVSLKYDLEFDVDPNFSFGEVDLDESYQSFNQSLIERINKFDALRSGLGSESLGSEYGFKYLIDAIDSCKEIGISLSKYLKLYNKKSLMKKRQFTKLYKTSDTNYHFNFSIC
jgi:hypothetical protein